MGASEGQTTDRRCAPRRPLHTRVALKTEKAIFFMESLDVSTSGIRLQSEVNIEIGTRCPRGTSRPEDDDACIR